jgi:hypothetical protein
MATQHRFSPTLACFALAAMLIGSAASAQTSNKTMAAGGTLSLGHFGMVNPDCTLKGKTTVRVTIAPAHGSVRLKDEKAFGDFWRPSPCSTRRVEGVTVEYRPERGFLGTDTVGLDFFFPSGEERSGTFYITVK